MADTALPQWMEDLLGDGREFIKKGADLLLFDKQLELAREAQAFSDTEAAERDQEARNLGGGGLSLGNLDPTLLILGLLGFAGLVLLLRR